MTAILDGTPQADFHSYRYLHNTARRLEHLATLSFNYDSKTVLELGAGIGDLTGFFADRGATVTATEGRPENLFVLAERYADNPRVNAHVLNLDPPPTFESDPYDVVVSYGLLYHLSAPATAIEYMANACRGMLLLETICSPGDEVNSPEQAEDPALAVTAFSGMGCRPTRRWVFDQLGERFDHVYMIRTTPAHPEFPTDWDNPSRTSANRGIFIASRSPIDHPDLAPQILDTHRVA